MNTPIPKQEVITLSFGHKRYHQQAWGLARSFRLHNPTWEGRFSIATDGSHCLPKDLKWVNLIPVDDFDLREPWLNKLRFGDFSRAQRVLFLDSDSLVFGSILPVFERFSGSPFAVVGRVISDGDWYGSVDEISKVLGVSGYPRFSGGMFYLDKKLGGDELLKRALNLAERYDSIGWRRLGGKINDEPCVAAAMAQLGYAPIPENGRTSVCILDAPEVKTLDVLSGKAIISPHRITANSWFRIQDAQPTIVHFAAQSPELPPYSRELAKITLRFTTFLPDFLIRKVSFLKAELPHKLRRLLPRFMRRSLVKKGPRVLDFTKTA